MSAGAVQARLVYDGECGFCRYTVAYARAVTGDAVEYRTYQDVADEHVDVDRSEFAASIQLFAENGARHSGARAAFEVLAIGGRRGWLRIYEHVPGAGVIFEWLYAAVSTHREASDRLARCLFGRTLGPREHSQTADWLYRGIALCGLMAFVSLWWQVTALIGAAGILPVSGFLDQVAHTYGWERLWLLPTLLWLDASDTALHCLCAAGVLATVVGLTGRLRATVAVVAYACYLSLVHGGQLFMSYQWDVLLAECFVLAAILARAPTLGIWVARLLLFRFMLLSGAVKLLSGDPTWADGSALWYHFETQPLPTALAWYAHHLPRSLLEWGVYATFFIELVLPVCVFLPRNPRLVAGAGFVLLELLIMLTGSYNFFNLLTIVLCIALFDDGSLKRLRGIRPPSRQRWLTNAVATWVLAQGLILVGATLTKSPPPAPVRATAPLLVANAYGLFAVMTTHRDELMVEGSMNGQDWHAYKFPFKPGALDQPPRLAAPHQPRLDWQMWFAALGRPQDAPWIYDLVIALLEGRPAVQSLLEDPFSGRAPAYVRIQRHRYEFTSLAERTATGAWWKRGPAEEWLAPARLRTPTITHEPLELE